MQDLISVIVPAYNVEPYIEKCIQSIINQTWDNIEILIIDDGSTDNTGIICDSLALQYSSIKVIHQKNAGLSVARNNGIEESKGNWLAFLDSDDWIEPEMYEILHKIAVENNVLLSSCLSRDVNLNETPPDMNDSEAITLLTYDDICSGLLLGNRMRFEVWNKLWARDLIGDVRFIPGQVAEDIHFDQILFDKAKRIAHIDKRMHNYLILRPGNTNSSFKTARLCIFEEFKEWNSKLHQDDRDDLASIISAIACNFAVDIYRNAIKSEQDVSLLRELRNYFIYFYPQAKKCVVKTSIKRRVKLEMFRISEKSVYLY